MITALCRLFRLRLALANGVAAVGGYLLFPAAAATASLVALFAGVSLLAAAGSALNQVAERDLDRLMPRTQGRPLPRGELTPGKATLIGAGLAAAGGAILFSFGSALCASLGGGALLWYLAVYTPLKRRTPLALAAGALCGAVPPLIGWCLAGGTPGDFRVVLLCGIFYLWQVPHFWLLQRRHAEEYRRAGFPLFEPSPGLGGLAAVCRLWIVALLAAALMLPLFGLAGKGAAFGIGAFFLCTPLLPAAFGRHERVLFAGLNLFPILITLSLCAG